jgi:FYVE/RhoGEF/PH domain-containing protein 5/6
MPVSPRRLAHLPPSLTSGADSEEERDEWVAAIRAAKAALLISLNAMHPNSTLTTSRSTAHIRRTLQALPHLPEDEAAGKRPRRGRVEHFVPPIWIPDAKTANCMRCARSFGWRRRRHHCRLCGRCVCSGCSGMVGRPLARACPAHTACTDVLHLRVVRQGVE